MTISGQRLTEAGLVAKQGDLPRVLALLDGLPYAAKLGAKMLTEAIRHRQWHVADALAGRVSVSHFQHSALTAAIEADQVALFRAMLPHAAPLGSPDYPWRAALAHANAAFFEGLLQRLPREWRANHRHWVTSVWDRAMKAPHAERRLAFALAVPLALLPEDAYAVVDALMLAQPEGAGALVAHAGPLAPRFPQALAHHRQAVLAQRSVATSRTRPRA